MRGALRAGAISSERGTRVWLEHDEDAVSSADDGSPPRTETMNHPGRARIATGFQAATVSVARLFVASASESFSETISIVTLVAGVWAKGFSNA